MDEAACIKGLLEKEVGVTSSTVARWTSRLPCLGVILSLVPLPSHIDSTAPVKVVACLVRVGVECPGGLERKRDGVEVRHGAAARTGLSGPLILQDMWLSRHTPMSTPPTGERASHSREHLTAAQIIESTLRATAANERTEIMSPTTLGTRCSRSVSLKALFSLAVLVLVAIEIPTAMAGTEGDTAAALKWEPVDPGFARYGAAGAFIPKSGALIVFGGAGPNGLRDSGLLVLDTRNRRMTLQMPPGNSPPQRQGLSAVYDPAGDRVIVFGGADYHTGFNDVWALSVTPKIEWSRLNPAGDLPAPRSWHAATIDTGRHRLIIFGGIADSGALLNDAWSLSLDGTPEWTRVDAKESAYPSAGR